jgi:hypothetical protein
MERSIRFIQKKISDKFNFQTGLSGCAFQTGKRAGGQVFRQVGIGMTKSANFQKFPEGHFLTITAANMVSEL